MINSTSDVNSRSNFDLNLEGLRGFAAISVAFSHLFEFKNFLDPSYHPATYLRYLMPAHSSVLIFFLLSGYLIGLTNSSNKFSINNTKLYLIRRGIRLIPVYWIAVSLSVLINSYRNSWVDILGNFIFLQNALGLFKLLQSNFILWSLNYEVVYYLLFLVIWWLKPKLLNVIILSLLASTIGWFSPQFPQIIHSYAAGWIFWLMGLYLAWYTKPTNSEGLKIPLISYLLLLTATNGLSIGKVFLYILGLKNQTDPIVSFADLTYLPICLLLFSTITNRHLVNLKWLEITCVILPLITTIGLTITGRLYENFSWMMAALFTITAILLWRFKIDVKILKNLSSMGRISYSFYILHMPIMKLVLEIFPYQGSIWSFTLRSIFWLSLTISISILLDIVIQPIIKNFLSKRLLT